MLGPEQPYHKKHSLEKAGQQSAKDDGANYCGARYSWVSYSRMDLGDPHLFTKFSDNYATIQNAVVLNEINLSYPNV